MWGRLPACAAVGYRRCLGGLPDGSAIVEQGHAPLSDRFETLLPQPLTIGRSFPICPTPASTRDTQRAKLRYGSRLGKQVGRGSN